MNTGKICLLGILIAISMLLSYVETLVTLIPLIPGFKVGFANIGVLFCLYKFSEKDAFLVLVLRITLVGFIFTSLSAIIYSLIGGVFAFAIMVLLKKSNQFSIYAISAAGGVAHNLGQLIVAMLVLNTKAVISYMPLLIIFGTVSGFLMGIISNEINKRIIFTEKIR